MDNNLIREACPPIPHHCPLPQEELKGVVRPVANLYGGDEMPLGLPQCPLHLLPAEHLGSQQLGAARQTTFSYRPGQLVELVAKEIHQPLGRKVASFFSLCVDGIWVVFVVIYHGHFLPLEA